VDAVSSATRGGWVPQPPPPACGEGWNQVTHPTAAYTVCVPDGMKASEQPNEWSFTDDKGKSLSLTLQPGVNSEAQIVAPLVQFLSAKHLPAIPVEGAVHKWVEKGGRGAGWWQAWPIVHYRYGLLVTAHCTGTEGVCGAYLQAASVAAATILWPGDAGMYPYTSWVALQKDFLTVYALPGSVASTQLEWLHQQYLVRHGAVISVTGCDKRPAASVYLYPSKAELLRYTRSETPFLVPGSDEVHAVFESKEAGLTGGDQVAKAVLTHVWGRGGSALMDRGVPLAIEGAGIDYKALAKKALEQHPMPLTTLLLADAWAKPDLANEQAVAAAFAQYILETLGSEGLRPLYQSQDLLGESVKLTTKSFQELETGFLRSLELAK